MAISEKTKTLVASELIKETNDLYPYATTLSRNASVWPTADTIRRLSDDIPTTTKDMSRAFKWEYGDKVYGTHAKENEGLRVHRRDINTDYGTQDDYKDVYIDTFLGEINDRLKTGDL